MEFIGKELSDVVKYFNDKKIKYEIQDNNYSVNGDTVLVTNIKYNDGYVTIYTGNFIFDVENKPTADNK